MLELQIKREGLPLKLIKKSLSGNLIFIMKVIKLVFKKICPKCEAVYRETIFEGAKEYFDQILDSDRFYLPQFECCENTFYADSYEILLDNRLVRDGRIDDVFDVESQKDLT